MGELNLDEIKPWLAMCGGCDAGIGSCTHPEADYRPVMAALLAEVERLRAELDAIGDLAYRFSYHESPSAVDDLLIAIVGRAKRAARGGESGG